MEPERPIGFSWTVSYRLIRYCYEARPGTVEVLWAQERWQAVCQALHILEQKYGRQTDSFKPADLIGQYARRVSGPIPRPDYIAEQLSLAL